MSLVRDTCRTVNDKPRPDLLSLILVVCFVLAMGILNYRLMDEEQQVLQAATQRAEEDKAKLYAILARCMSEPSTIFVGAEPVTDCKPRKK